MNLSAKKNQFLTASPFPNLILDDFLDDNYFLKLNNVFEDMSKITSGKKFNSVVEKNKWISLNSSLPGAIKEIVDTLNSDVWIDNMRCLTGIKSLVATKSGNTKLANYHVMEAGGILGSHVDHSFEPELGLPHVLNIIIYLSENWEVTAGGETLFFDKKGRKILKKVEYKKNRAVVFLHTPHSFHGVERITSNCKVKRRTLYVDYYSKSYNPYEGIPLAFSTRWFKHGTMFKLKSVFDYFSPANKKYAKSFLQYHKNKLLYKVKKNDGK